VLQQTGGPARVNQDPEPFKLTRAWFTASATRPPLVLEHPTSFTCSWGFTQHHAPKCRSLLPKPRARTGSDDPALSLANEPQSLVQRYSSAWLAACTSCTTELLLLAARGCPRATTSKPWSLRLCDASACGAADDLDVAHAAPSDKLRDAACHNMYKHELQVVLWFRAKPIFCVVQGIHQIIRRWYAYESRSRSISSNSEGRR